MKCSPRPKKKDLMGPIDCNHKLHRQDCQKARRIGFAGVPGSLKKNDGEKPLLHRFPIQLKSLCFRQDSVTVMAPVGQTAIQLSQPKHSSMFTGSDLPSFISKTPTGQVSTHSPFPSHLLLSTVTVYMLPFSYPDGFKWGCFSTLCYNDFRRIEKFPS